MESCILKGELLDVFYNFFKNVNLTAIQKFLEEFIELVFKYNEIYYSTTEQIFLGQNSFDYNGQLLFWLTFICLYRV